MVFVAAGDFRCWEWPSAVANGRKAGCDFRRSGATACSGLRMCAVSPILNAVPVATHALRRAAFSYLCAAYQLAP